MLLNIVEIYKEDYEILILIKYNDYYHFINK